MSIQASKNLFNINIILIIYMFKFTDKYGLKVSEFLTF